MQKTKKVFLKNELRSLILPSILFLFLLRLISEFIETTYALCSIIASVNADVFAVLFLVFLILLVFCKSGLINTLKTIIGVFIIFRRVLAPMLTTQNRMVVSGFRFLSVC